MNWLRLQTALTEQREFEARVAQATSDDRAAFLASMTHNLRTPLATIKGALSALLVTSDDDAERRRRLVTNARAETDRLERLVTKVLELARIHAGGARTQPRAGRPRRARGSRRAAACTTSRTSMDFAWWSTTTHSCCASVDPDMLELVFVVMLENALRFAPPNSEIEVIVNRASNEEAAEIRVVDHGPGIPTSSREAVFDEFVRLDRDGSGSGLGLAIARSMVDAHGGRIWIDETPGGGATVVVRLPTLSADAFV